MLQWALSVNTSLEILFPILLDEYPEHVVALILILRNHHTLSIMATLIYIPTNRAQRFQCLYILTTLAVSFSSFKYNSHSNASEVISLWFLICISLIICAVEHFLIQLYLCVCLLWGKVYTNDYLLCLLKQVHSSSMNQNYLTPCKSMPLNICCRR